MMTHDELIKTHDDLIMTHDEIIMGPDEIIMGHHLPDSAIFQLIEHLFDCVILPETGTNQNAAVTTVEGKSYKHLSH